MLHPEWSYQAVIYEMNVRQLTREGTLRAAAAKLGFLRDMGIDAVWLMPVYPIGAEGRKGSLGSYYSIRDYCAVDPGPTPWSSGCAGTPSMVSAATWRCSCPWSSGMRRPAACGR